MRLRPLILQIARLSGASDGSEGVDVPKMLPRASALGGGQAVAEGAELIGRMATTGKDDPTGALRETAGELAW